MATARRHDEELDQARVGGDQGIWDFQLFQNKNNSLSEALSHDLKIVQQEDPKIVEDVVHRADQERLGDSLEVATQVEEDEYYEYYDEQDTCPAGGWPRWQMAAAVLGGAFLAVLGSVLLGLAAYSVALALTQVGSHSPPAEPLLPTEVAVGWPAGSCLGSLPCWGAPPASGRVLGFDLVATAALHLPQQPQPEGPAPTCSAPTCPAWAPLLLGGSRPSAGQGPQQGDVRRLAAVRPLPVAWCLLPEEFMRAAGRRLGAALRDLVGAVGQWLAWEGLGWSGQAMLLACAVGTILAVGAVWAWRAAQPRTLREKVRAAIVPMMDSTVVSRINPNSYVNVETVETKTKARTYRARFLAGDIAWMQGDIGWIKQRDTKTEACRDQDVVRAAAGKAPLCRLLVPLCEPLRAMHLACVDDAERRALLAVVVEVLKEL